jgi:naphthoate synthase
MNPFQVAQWEELKKFDDITYHQHISEPLVRIAFNRPERRNAFRPGTVDELITAFQDVGRRTDIGTVMLTGNGPSQKDGGWAFCSGGDQKVRGETGYLPEQGESGRLHILECQRLIRFLPKVVIAAVPGWAVGGGHSLHVVCDLTFASAKHAKFLQTDPDVASFDAGYGSALLARQVGQKRAREIFFMGKTYSAHEAKELGMVNEVVEHSQLEQSVVDFAHRLRFKSPTAIKMLKYAFNMADDGFVGQQIFAGEATRLAYATDEAKEGRDSFLEKREKRFDHFPWLY